MNKAILRIVEYLIGFINHIYVSTIQLSSKSNTQGVAVGISDALV